MIDQKNIYDSYKYYRQTNTEWIPNLDYKKGIPVYIKIVNGLIKYIVKKIFEGYMVRLGGKLGVIGIVGEKVKPIIVTDENGKEIIKGLAPNWGETKKLQARDEKAREDRTIVFCFNEHSNGIKYRLLWLKKDVYITNKKYYSLTFCREVKRTLPRKVIDEGMSYFTLDEGILVKDWYKEFLGQEEQLNNNHG